MLRAIALVAVASIVAAAVPSAQIAAQDKPQDTLKVEPASAATGTPPSESSGSAREFSGSTVSCSKSCTPRAAARPSRL